MIRKSEKSGVSVETVTPTQEWAEGYYAMLRATFERQGRAVPHPISFFRQLVAVAVAERGEVRLISAYHDGEVIASTIFLVDNTRMLYLSGTANAQGMKLAANSLIQWHAIRTAIEDGITLYDMGGLGVPSIDKFKRSFGGQDLSHHRWVHRTYLFRLAEPLARWAKSKGLLRIGGGDG